MTFKENTKKAINDYTIPALGIVAMLWCTDFKLREQGSSLPNETYKAATTVYEVAKEYLWYTPFLDLEF